MSTTTKRTITLSDSPPVSIIESEWAPRYIIDECNGKNRYLTYRIKHDNSRAVVYAVQKRPGSFKTEHAAGYLCSVDEIAATILDVVEEMEEKTGVDWMPLADKLIRKLKPVEI